MILDPQLPDSFMLSLGHLFQLHIRFSWRGVAERLAYVGISSGSEIEINYVLSDTHVSRHIGPH